MQDYITQQCRKRNVNIPQIDDKINYSELGIYSSNNSRQWGELKEYVETEHPNSQIKSTKYIDSDTKLEFQCEKGHIFWIAPANVKRGKWCNECGHIKQSMKMKEIWKKRKRNLIKIK